MSTDWNTVFEKNWAKAVVQATSFWNAVQNDKVKPLRHCKGKRPLLMVVTLTDADWRAGRPDLATALSPHLPSDKAYIPFTAVSIHRLEQLVSAWEARTVEWLPEVLSDALQRGATDAIGSQTSKSDGKLTKAFGPIFEKLSAQVTSKSAGEGRHAQ